MGSYDEIFNNVQLSNKIFCKIEETDKIDTEKQQQQQYHQQTNNENHNLGKC